MNQVCIEWKNTIDEQDHGAVKTRLPLTIGRAAYNDIVLPMLSAGVASTHAQLKNIGGTLMLVDLRDKNIAFGSAPKPVGWKKTFNIGLYCLTVSA